MRTLLIYPAQVFGISEAVTQLEKYRLNDDEYVHVSELSDGSGTLKIELTNPPYRRFVTEDGTVTVKRPQ